MTDLHVTRSVKAVRQPAFCYQCNKMIEVGSPAEYVFGKYEGDLYSLYIHPECDAAARDYAKLNGLWGEEFPFFPEMEDSEWGHHGWLLDNHPVVASRLGIVCEVVQ